MWGGKESYRFTKMVREASEARAFQRLKGGSLGKAGTLARVSVISTGRGPRIWANRRPRHQRRLERGKLRQVKQQGMDGRLRWGILALLGESGPLLHLILVLKGPLTHLWLPKRRGSGEGTN